MNVDIKDFKKSLDYFNGRLVHLEYKQETSQHDVGWMRTSHTSLLQENEKHVKVQQTINERYDHHNMML